LLGKRFEGEGRRIHKIDVIAIRGSEPLTDRLIWKFTVVRTRHDRFAKEWLKELLTDFGEVKTEREVSGEVRSIDLVFSPYLDQVDDLQPLGLLGRILARPCCPMTSGRS
jgi:hypothetical protein